MTRIDQSKIAAVTLKNTNGQLPAIYMTLQQSKVSDRGIGRTLQAFFFLPRQADDNYILITMSSNQFQNPKSKNVT